METTHTAEMLVISIVGAMHLQCTMDPKQCAKSLIVTAVIALEHLQSTRKRVSIQYSNFDTQ